MTSATDETIGETLTCLSCRSRERTGGRWPTSRCGNRRSPHHGRECMAGMTCGEHSRKWTPPASVPSRAMSEELL